MSTGNDPILVRKYGNRRLYRTDLSRYVTLDELADLVRDDVEFVVHDAKTGQDLTGVVLSQIVMEAEKRGTGPLPVSLLRMLIKIQGSGHTVSVLLRAPLQLMYNVARGGLEALEEALGRFGDPEADDGVAEGEIIGKLGVASEMLTGVLEQLEVEDGDPDA